MTSPSRIRSSLAIFLLAGSSLIGCGQESPPPTTPPATPGPAVDTGPPSGAASDAAAAKPAHK